MKGSDGINNHNNGNLKDVSSSLVRKLSDTNMCQIYVRKVLEISQICISFIKCDRKLSFTDLENSWKSVRLMTFD